jgi:hypothetical protein
MVNKKLINYIKQELELGTSREEIKNSLISNGWTDEEIEEAFNTLDRISSGSQILSSKTKEQSNKWRIILFSFVALAIFGSVVYFAFQSFFGTENKPDIISEHQPEEEAQLSLEILNLKDVYEVGEKFSGKYLIDYKGESFEGIVLYKCGPAYTKEFKVIDPGITELPFLNFSGGSEEISEGNYRLTQHSDTFSREGEFEYVASIYKCSDLDLGERECSDDLSDFRLSLFSDVDPIASVSKTIKVVERSLSSSISEDKNTILKCLENEDSQCILEFLDLFKERLQSCEPSEGTVTIGWEPAMGIVRGYRILGEENGLCVVTFWFLDTRDLFSDTEDFPESLLNKQMNCEYSESERTIEKVAGAENCTGPLLEELNKILEQ